VGIPRDTRGRGKARYAYGMAMTKPTRLITLHVGTYTDGASRGIYRLDFDLATGVLGEPELAAESINPAFLAWHPRLPVLYTVSETDTGPDKQGLVIAFAAAADGGLTKLNEQPSGGAAPCYVSVDPSGARVFVANYHGASVAALPIGTDGRLHPASSIVRHYGSSVHPVRQRKPYLHTIVPAPLAHTAMSAASAASAAPGVPDASADGAAAAIESDTVNGPAASATADAALASRATETPVTPRDLGVVAEQGTRRASFALAADLGSDQVLVYRIDEPSGLLTLNGEDAGAVATAPGAGPRHLAFARAGDAVFVINELNSTIASYAWDAARGTLERRGDPVSTLPADFTGDNTTAEIAVHPNGRFLYGSNRGHDSIAIFRIGSGRDSGSASDHRLTRVGLHGTHGKTPRHFAIDPTGAFLIAANQDSDSLVVFRIDPDTGLLTDTIARAHVPSPACVRFRSLPSIA
jgi:6-phosphogluconolactonase (cycloisomerase 2 family)